MLPDSGLFLVCLCETAHLKLQRVCNQMSSVLHVCTAELTLVSMAHAMPQMTDSALPGSALPDSGVFPLA